MKLGIFCFRGSGCAFLIYPAQAHNITVFECETDEDELDEEGDEEEE